MAMRQRTSRSGNMQWACREAESFGRGSRQCLHRWSAGLRFMSPPQLHARNSMGARILLRRRLKLPLKRPARWMPAESACAGEASPAPPLEEPSGDGIAAPPTDVQAALRGAASRHPPMSTAIAPMIGLETATHVGSRPTAMNCSRVMSAGRGSAG